MLNNKISFKETLNRTKFLLKNFLFWLILLQVCRIIFVFYHFSKLSGISNPEIFKIFFFGMYMDLSTASYIIAIPLLIWIFQLFYTSPFINKIIKWYNYIIIIILSLASVGDMQLYKEWGSKLDYDAMSYLKYPKEAMASCASSPILLLLIIALAISITAIIIHNRIFLKTQFKQIKNTFSSVTIKFVLIFIVFSVYIITLRGGIDIVPMNPSFVYFSNHTFANHAALSPEWNLAYTYKKSKKTNKADFKFMSDDEMNKRMDKLFPETDSSKITHILKTNKKPNIIICILESFTADVFESLNGAKGLTPNLKRIINQGILFTNFHPGGRRTPNAFPSILAGFPSIPNDNIINHTKKLEHLSYLPKTLKSNGYHTSFYYGGLTEFANIKAFIKNCNYDDITDKSDFEKKDLNSKWGAHDHVVFNKIINDVNNNMPEPFMINIMTLSSHEPFEVPMKTQIKGNDEVSLFKNSIFYTDKSIGEFIEKAKNEKWFDNTLFVFVADHGHRLPLLRNDASSVERYHIPLILYGNVLKDEFKGKKINTIGSQTDIPATILGQINIDYSNFLWSNNLFDENKNKFAFYAYKYGYGWITPQQTLVYDNTAKKIIKKYRKTSDSVNNECLKNSQAYLQYLYTIFSDFK